MVCKKIFLNKGRNKNKYFCTGFPKSDVRGCKQNCSKKNCIGVSATKSWEKSRLEGESCVIMVST